MSPRTTRRRKPQIVVWLAVGLGAVAVSSCLALSVWTWMQEDELKALRTSLRAQQAERGTSEARIVALQGTTTALAEHLAILEAGTQQQEPVASGRAGGGSLESPQELVDLQAALAEIQGEVETLRSAVIDMVDHVHEGQDSAAAEPTRSMSDTVRLTVERQQQSHNLSCESSAASMVAQYHGWQLSEQEVLAALPYNANPHLGFRGNVDGPTGGTADYGVYAEPILDILNARGLHAVRTDGGLEGIRSAISRGNPVIAWVTYNCQPSTPVTELVDGQQVTLVPYQHVVVVTGFSSEGVWANDPWDGQEDFYTTSDFARAMSYFGNMAIEVAKP